MGVIPLPRRPTCLQGKHPLERPDPYSALSGASCLCSTCLLPSLSPCASCAFSFSSLSPFPHLSRINRAPWQTHEKHVEVTPMAPSNPSEQFPFLLIGLQIPRTTRPFIQRTQAQLFAAGKSLSDAGSRTGCWVPLRGTRAHGAKPGCCRASCVPASAQRHHVNNLQEKNPPLILQVLGWGNVK